MVIDLENLYGLPQEFIIRLNEFDSLFKQFEFLEDYETEIYQLIADINNYCLENEIIGYHYTNAIENDILEKGIIIRKGKDIRKEFKKRHFHLFTKDEQIQILNNWDKLFGEGDVKNRDNRVYFNFTKHALQNGGAELLLNYYGGEQVYFPIFELPQIGTKLKKIGIPMILECTLNPNDISTFIQYPWGKIVVSSYNKIINSKAYAIDQDGYQKVNVSPKKIKIIKYKKHIC
ncbi:MAG: hypothetical protein GQ564_15415 [Bacteroidales bacterium]|nr:hypothetical protein [Bacteroidales bacterium]